MLEIGSGENAANTIFYYFLGEKGLTLSAC